MSRSSNNGTKAIPGPGHYNISNGNFWPRCSYTTPKVQCFFKGADTCWKCETYLFGDYYKSSSRKMCFCLTCYQEIFDPIRRTPLFAKVRHCSVNHKHIDVENIVYHKTTQKKIRRLNLMEKQMWNKFGEILDFNGKPI